MFKQRSRFVFVQHIRLAVVFLGLTALTSECVQAQGNCKQIKGELVIVPKSGTSVGEITNSGDLKGTFTAVDTVSVGFATPDPKVVSYTQDLIISTRDGQLTATSVWLFDFSNLPSLGAVSGIARIGPTSATTGNATSTGRFAGATGFYFITGTSAPDGAGNFIGLAEITGQVCYP